MKLHQVVEVIDKRRVPEGWQYLVRLDCRCRRSVVYATQTPPTRLKCYVCDRKDPA